MDKKEPNQIVLFKLKKSSHYLTAFAFLFFIFLLPPLSGTGSQNEKIVEEVSVENIVVPVRVFDGNKQVPGLKKEDFQLFINGKPYDINGFYSQKKVLELIDTKPGSAPKAVAAPAISPRLFVLIFNITDFKMDIDTYIDTLFKRVIRPKDRVIVISNRYIFPEWEVVSPQDLKKKVLDVLKKEVAYIKEESIRYEVELNIIRNEYYNKMKDPHFIIHPSIVFEDFFLNYQFIIDDIRGSYLNLPVDQYIKISHYLKGLDIDRYVLNFFEIGRLPFLNRNSDIFKKANFYYTAREKEILDSYPRPIIEERRIPEDPSTTKSVIKRYFYQYLQVQNQFDNILLNDIKKSFLNSGATFHTLLLSPADLPPLMDFDYKKISTEGETILKTIAGETGGSVVTSNKIGTFLNKIAASEDILYVMSYAPKSADRSGKLEIRVKNKKYRAVYDDQRRKKSFRGIVRQINKNKKHLEICGLIYTNNKIAVKLKNIELVDFQGSSFGAVRVRIKIMDKDENLVKNFEKTYKGINREGEFQIPLPELPAKGHKVVVEVKDLFALNGVYTGDAITVE